MRIVFKEVCLVLFMFSVFLVSSSLVLADDAPIVPAFFYGDALVNGKAVPVDSVIYSFNLRCIGHKL